MTPVEPQFGEFVQILILSDRNHLKVFVKDPGGDEVHVCDSLNSYGRGYSRETSKSICQKSFCSSATLQIICLYSISPITSIVGYLQLHSQQIVF